MKFFNRKTRDTALKEEPIGGKRFDSELWTSSDDTQANDIFLVSFPKCGNTWMRFMLTGVIYKMNMSVKSGRLVSDLIPDLDQYPVYTRMLDRMCFKSHKLPQARMRNVIYVSRDGRDAICSYRKMQELMGRDITLEDLVFERTKFHNTTWREHHEAWLSNPYEAKLSFVKYEDLLVNPVGELSRVVREMNLEIDDSLLAEITSNCGFKQMKKSAINQPSETKVSIKGGLINKGKSGNYRDVMDADLIAEFNKRNESMLLKLGYSI